MRDSERELDKIFLSYNKILARLNKQGCKTKNGKEITHKDLRKAILVMQEKHPKCRWRSNKVRSRKFYILDEGYWWIVEVFFQNELDLIDADIKYFKKRIKLYEDFLKIKPKELFVNNIPYSQVENFFNRKLYTIKRAIRFKMSRNKIYIYTKDEKTNLTKEEGGNK